MGEFIAASTPWDNVDADWYINIGTSSAYKYRGCSFVVPVEGSKLKKIKTKLRKNGTPAGNLYFAIYDLDVTGTNTADEPHTQLHSELVTGLTTDYQEIEFDLTSLNLTLTPLKLYYVVFYVDTVGSVSHCYHWHRNMTNAITWASGQLGQGESVSFSIFYSSVGTPTNWTSSGSDPYPAMRITVTHDDKSLLWSNNSTVAHKLEKFRFGYDETEYKAAWKITTPDDGKYREIESFAPSFFLADDAALELLFHISIHEDSSAAPADLVVNGITSMSRAACPVGSSAYLWTPPIFRWSDNKPVLSPNTTYWFLMNPGWVITGDPGYVHTDSTNGGDGETFLIANDGSITPQDNMAVFYVHGTVLDEAPAVDDEYTYPNLIYTTSPPSYIGVQNIASGEIFKHIAYAFKPAHSCKLDKIRFWMKRYNCPTDRPLKARILQADGDNISDTVLLNLGVIADTTNSDETIYGLPYFHEKTLDCGSTLDLVAGTKYWIDFYCDSFSATHFWAVIDCSMVGTRKIGTPYTAETRCAAYDDAPDWPTPSYTIDAFPCAIIGRSSDGMETMVEEFVLGEAWASPSINFQKFFEDATERYLAQKFKTPVRANDIEIHSLGMSLSMANPYSYDFGVWAEIREVGGGDSIGAIVTNGTSDTICNSEPPDHASATPAFTQFTWTDVPVLSPDTEYWIVLKSDWMGTTKYWRAVYTDSSTLRFKGIIGGLYFLDGDLNKTAASGGNKNAAQFILNGVEQVPVIGPPRDFVFKWNLTEAFNRDTILRWPLTTGIGDQDWALLWHLVTQVDKDWALLWKLVLSSDTTFLWTIIEPTVKDWVMSWSLQQKIDEDWILKWKLLLSQDTTLPWSINFPRERDTVLRWPLTTDIGDQDWILLWKLILSRDTVLRWHLMHFFTVDWTTKWGIQVATDTVLPIPLMAQVDEAKRFLWNIEDRIWRDFVLKYNLPISREWVIRYSLNDVISRVYTIVNEIGNQVKRDWGIKYTIKLERDHILLIPLMGEVTKDSVLRHDLMGAVEDTHVIKYDLLDYNPVAADTILRNSLLGKPRFYKITFS